MRPRKGVSRSSKFRLYVALMGAAQKLFETYGEAVDPWMTLVGYFSALRELAGMSRLVRDDVATRLSTKAIRTEDLAGASSATPENSPHGSTRARFRDPRSAQHHVPQGPC